MKVFVALLAVCAVASAAVIPEWEPVDIHYVKEWRDAFPELAALMPIDLDIPTSRITGGQAASVGQFPYQAQVTSAFSAGSGLCGGSIISTTWVLTAAHCTDPAAGVQSVTVALGSHNRLSLDTGEQRRPVLQNTLHPQWTASVIRNDVAVLRFAVAALSTTIQTVTMAPTGSGTFAGSTARASGWGRTGDGAAQGAATILQWVDLPVITNAVCSQTFGIVVDTTLCTSGAGGRNICSGDSGGPLVFNNQQIGIVNFGAAAGCTLGHPAGFARVSSFRAWIQTTTGV